MAGLDLDFNALPVPGQPPPPGQPQPTPGQPQPTPDKPQITYKKATDLDFTNDGGGDGGNQPKVGVAEDVTRSIGSGLRTGLEGIPGMPGDISGLGRKGLSKVAGWMGASPETQKSITDYDIPYLPNLSSETVHAATTPIVGESYKPQTIYGKYARTGAEFVPGILTAPEKTLPEMGVKAAIAVGSGLASEAAGQATEGTKWEPWARAVTGIAAGGGGEAAAKGRQGALSAADRAQEATKEDQALRYGVKLTKGQRTGDVAQQIEEQQMLRNVKGEWAQRLMEQRQRANMEGIKDASAGIADVTAPTRGTTPVQSGSLLNQQVRQRTEDAMTQGGQKITDATHSGVMTPTSHLLDLPDQLRTDLAGPHPFVPEHILDENTPMANNAMKRIDTFVSQAKNPNAVEFSLAGAEYMRQKLAKLQASAAPHSTDAAALGQIRDTFENWMTGGVGKSRIDAAQIPPGATAPTSVNDVLSGLQAGRTQYGEGASIARPRANEIKQPGARTVAEIATNASDEATTRLFTPNNRGDMSPGAIKAFDRLVKTGATSGELDQVRGIVLDHLTSGDAPGTIATRLDNFTNRNPTVAEQLFTPGELDQLRGMGKTSGALVPKKEAINPSGTSYPLIKAAKDLAAKGVEQGAGALGSLVYGTPGYLTGVGTAKAAIGGLRALNARSAVNRALEPADRRSLAEIMLQGAASGGRVGAIPAIRNLQK